MHKLFFLFLIFSFSINGASEPIKKLVIKNKKLEMPSYATFIQFAELRAVLTKEMNKVGVKCCYGWNNRMSPVDCDKVTTGGYFLSESSESIQRSYSPFGELPGLIDWDEGSVSLFRKAKVATAAIKKRLTLDLVEDDAENHTKIYAVCAIDGKPLPKAEWAKRVSRENDKAELVGCYNTFREKYASDQPVDKSDEKNDEI